MVVVSSMPVLVIFGQCCSDGNWWVKNYTTEVLEAFPAAEFFFPPKVPDQNGELMWHPYEADETCDETHDATHRAPNYADYIKWTGDKVWKRLQHFEDSKQEFGVIAISNGGALGFEASTRYRMARFVLWQASVPVFSQQGLNQEPLCPTGFLIGDCDRVFGGTKMVEPVAKRFKSRFWTYEGGHSNCPVTDTAAAVAALLN